VNYDSDGLIPLGVIPGDNLTDVIKTINNIFADVLLKIDGDAKNLGEGSKVYKGKNSEGVIEYRTLTGGTGIVLTQTATEIKIAADEEWLQEYLREYLNEQWFDQHFRNIIKQPWFADYLQTLFLQDWFGDILSHWIKKEWFLLYLQSLIKQPWFKSVLELHLSQPWFEALLKTIFYKPWFSKLLAELLEQSWFVDLVRDLVSKVNGIDIYHSGIGSALFTKVSDNEYKFKGIESADGSIVIRDNGESIDLSVVLPEKVSLSSTDGSVTITEVGNGFNLSVPKPVTRAVSGVGSDGSVSLVHDADADKIEISKLKSNSLKITKQPSGEVTIESTDFNYIKEFHVNSNYVPTPDSPSDGSIIRPYRTFEEARTAFIGTGSVAEPQYKGSTITLHTSSDTNANPTVNGMHIKLLNNVALRYTGSDEYMFDSTLQALDLKAPDGTYKRGFNQRIYGEGTLTRTSGSGIMRAVEKGTGLDGTKSDVERNISINFMIGSGEDGEIIRFIPAVILSTDSDAHQLQPDGTKIGDIYYPPLNLRLRPMSKGNTPVVYIEGLGYGSFQYSIFFQSNVIMYGDFINSALHAKNSFIGGNSKINLQVVHGQISHNVLLPVKDGTYHPSYGGIYAPVADTSLVVLENTGIYNFTVTYNQVGDFGHAGYENFFKLIGEVPYFSNVEVTGGHFSENFLNLEEFEGTSLHLGMFKTNGFKRGTPSVNFAKVSKPTTIVIPNYFINGYRQLSNGDVTINTQGTLSSIGEVPYITGFDKLNGGGNTARTETAVNPGA